MDCSYSCLDVSGLVSAHIDQLNMIHSRLSLRRKRRSSGTGSCNGRDVCSGTDRVACIVMCMSLMELASLFPYLALQYLA